MPIHVEIRINHELIDTIHIGRMEELKGRDQSHQYLVTNKTTKSMVDWTDPNAVEFEHNYSEGAHICVAKALEAWDKKRREQWDMMQEPGVQKD
jgi:hypothetical protein